MTFAFNLKTWLKVATHNLPKTSVYVKYDPDRAKGRVISHQMLLGVARYDLDLGTSFNATLRPLTKALCG